MRRLIAVTTAVGLGLAAFATAAPASGASSGAASSTNASVPVTPSTIAWGPCTDDQFLANRGAQCGMLQVPLDYSKPRGAQIELAVSRILHKTPDSKYQGVMLTNPGGPGDSGLDLPYIGALVPNGAGRAYDWIGWAPRGVEPSVPSLSCEPDYFKGPRIPYVPTTSTLTKDWLALSAGYASACGANGGELLDHLTTLDTVKDMESIRKALGQSRINYFGYSYGTYLGQVYGTLYPQRVRRMILDSNVDPRTVWYQANLDQDTAFQRNLEIWFAWVAKYDSVYHLGTTRAAVQKLFDATQAQLDKHPAGGVVGGDEWNDIFLSAGYYQLTWLDLGETFASWIHDKDLAKLKQEYREAEGPGDDNGFAMYLATQCTDAPWPTSVAKNLSDNWRVYQQAPYETWNNAWYNAPCITWPAAPHAPVTIDGSRVTSTLLIDETLDAATPYEGSLETRRLFPNSVLLALPGGTSHANSLDGDACEDTTIARYLANGSLPSRKAGDNRADAYCAPLPVPVPTASAASASTTAAPLVASPTTSIAPGAAVLRQALQAAAGRS